MSNPIGTPRNLHEAIVHGFKLPVSAEVNLKNNVQSCVKDFLAQHFTKLACQDTITPEDVLALFKELTS